MCVSLSLLEISPKCVCLSLSSHTLPHDYNIPNPLHLNTQYVLTFSNFPLCHILHQSSQPMYISLFCVVHVYHHCYVSIMICVKVFSLFFMTPSDIILRSFLFRNFSPTLFFVFLSPLVSLTTFTKIIAGSNN